MNKSKLRTKAVNKHREAEAESMEVLGYASRDEYRDAKRDAQKMTDDGERNYKKLKELVLKYITKIILDTLTVPITKNETFVDGAVVIQVVIKGEEDKVALLDIGLRMHLKSIEDIDLDKISDIIQVKFIPLREFFDRIVETIIENEAQKMVVVRKELIKDDGEFLFNYYFDASKEKCSELEDRLEIFLSNTNLNLENVAKISFFNEHEKHK